MSLSAISKELRNRIFERDGGSCQYCLLSQIGQAAKFHINHVIPRSKGGPTETSNLVLQCPYCSLHKSNVLAATDPDSGEAVSIFHPLQQIWVDHFLIDNDGFCHGRSAVGRATVQVLCMNDSLPRIARLLQIRLGILSPTSN